MAHVHHHPAKKHAASDSSVLVAARVVYVLFGVIAVLIAIRMVMLLYAADPANWLVNFIYTASGIFVMPFFVVFGLSPTYGAPVFEIGSLVAFAFYILLGWGLAVTILSYGPWHSDNEE